MTLKKTRQNEIKLAKLKHGVTEKKKKTQRHSGWHGGRGEK